MERPTRSLYNTAELAAFDENEEFPDMPKNDKFLWDKE